MSENFDPYYKWLGIPPKHQPPTHYRLLGIEQFESDREVINSAANRLMAYLKTLSTGDDATAAQRLLNEAAAARRCLLDPQLKADYDGQLRGVPSPPVQAKAAPPAQPPAAPTPPPRGAEVPPAKVSVRLVKAVPPVQPSPSESLTSAPNRREQQRRQQQRSEASRNSNLLIWSIVAGVSGVAILIAIIVVASSGGGNANRQAAASSAAENPPARRSPEKAAEPRESRPAASPGRPQPETAALPQRPKSSVRNPPEPDDKTKEAAVEKPPAKAAAAAGSDDPVMEGLTPADAKPVADNGNADKGNDNGNTEKESTAQATEKKSNDDKPSEDKTTAPQPAENAKSDPTAKPPAVADPFAGLGDALELPSAEKAKPGEAAAATTLCALPLTDFKEVRFNIQGAAEVYGPAAKLNVAAADDAKSGHWRVELLAHEGSSESLADFSIQSGQLQFAWMPEADRGHAELFRNCFLEIVAAEKSHLFALRLPRVRDALTIQSDKGAPQQHNVATGAVPLGLQYQVEILGVTGPPPYQAAYAPPLSGGKGKPINIKWKCPDTIYPVSAQVVLESVTTSGFLIRTRLLVPSPNEKAVKQEKFYSSKGEAASLRRLAAGVAQYEHDMPPAANPKLVLAYEAQHPVEKQQYEGLKCMRRLEALSSDKSLREGVRIRYKIFAQVAGHRLDLVSGEAVQAVQP